jgi:hypothetical protein
MKLKQLVEEDQHQDGMNDMEDMYNQIKEEASEMEQSPDGHSRPPESLHSQQMIEPYQASV